MEVSLFHSSYRSVLLLSNELPYSNTNLLPTGRSQSIRRRRQNMLPCSCSLSSPEEIKKGRRELIGCLIASASGIALSDAANAVSTSRRALRGSKVPETEYTTLDNGLKYYDLKVGGGPEAVKGSRVAVRFVPPSFKFFFPKTVSKIKSVHYVAKWKGITFMTSRQGLGVGGGTPYGFDVGQSERGAVLKGLDLGVVGMRVGGQRLLIVPPELAYGNKGVQEIPPNATIEFDVELLAIKQSPFGSAVKVVEG